MILFRKNGSFKKLPKFRRWKKGAAPFYAQAADEFLSADPLPEPLRIRVQRSLSWLAESDRQYAQSLDCSFITLWIAFNAAYGNEMGQLEPSGDRAGYKEFIGTVCSMDSEGIIGNALFTTFSQGVRVLLDNRFCYQPFWNAVNGRASMADAAERFAEDRRKAYQALKTGDNSRLLSTVFDRLYTIRNQVLHGGSTCGGSSSRAVLKTGIGILRSVVPSILVVMLRHPGSDWGAPFYILPADGGADGWKDWLPK
jgi:hypothetical protein